MQALGLAKPGASPDLQFCLESLTSDPQMYAAVDTLRDARSLGSHADVVLGLDTGPLSDLAPTFNSLSEVLCQRLHQIGFEVLPHGLVRDAIGTFSFLDCAFGELWFRIQLSWVKVVAARISHRVDFAGFHGVDVVGTRRAYHSLDGFDQGAVRKHLHGANFSNDKAQFWNQSGTNLCKHCGAYDSLHHRLWTCPRTAESRDGLSVDFVHRLASLPQVLTVHGWTLCSSLRDSWLGYLDGLVCPPLPEVPPPCPILDLFTDGSCLVPADPDFRMAACSVIHAAPFQLDYGPDNFRPIVAAPLPGILQSAYRAELYALVCALSIAAKFESHVRIWSDCGSVIRVFEKHVRDQVPVNPNSKHSDLLVRMVSAARELGLSRIAVLQVPAHEDKTAFANELDLWLLDGNNIADASAVAANRARSAWVWNLWESYVQQTVQCREDGEAVRQLIVAVARLWTEDAVVTSLPSTPGVPVPPKRTDRRPQLKFSMPEPLQLVGRTFSKSFGPDLAAEVSTWISSIRSSASVIQWISFMHLFLSFQWRMGPIAISKRNGNWLVERGVGARLANHCKLSPRIKWFRLMLQQFFKDTNTVFVTGTVRPYSNWICCFRGSIGFPMDVDEYNMIESYLQRSLGTPATGSGKSLDAVRV